ncbi:MAG: hypothetical protein JWP42_4492 [Pseudomonas sp.]|nr:hypothetical protein [Pseudomonas sp.]
MDASADRAHELNTAPTPVNEFWGDPEKSSLVMILRLTAGGGFQSTGTH